MLMHKIFYGKCILYVQDSINHKFNANNIKPDSHSISLFRCRRSDYCALKFLVNYRSTVVSWEPTTSPRNVYL